MPTKQANPVLAQPAGVAPAPTNFPFVPVNGFTPNNSGWSTIGKITTCTVDPTGNRYTFFFGKGYSLFVEILGQTAYRLRFNPTPNPDYSSETSVAVVTRDLGLSNLKLKASKPSTNLLVLSTGSIDIEISLDPFAIAVKRSGQLIHCDQPGQGVLYIPGAEVTALMKTAAPGAHFLGLGEKAGSQLYKEGFTYTFSNFDNYEYSTGPSLGNPGPLNPTDPLYCSIPFLLEWNPFPSGAFSGNAYSCGTFLDNAAQTFVNIATNDYSDMTGKYYLGSLYNDLDQYFFAGDSIQPVLEQYTTLTGRSSMPPRYAFGFHQGAYGYYDAEKLEAVAQSYRSAGIPCDGLHIDVDFQDNYRTFTHSEQKFPNAAGLFASLHQQGFKMSTNITPLLTDNALDESGAQRPYDQRQNLANAAGLITDARFGEGPNTDLYEGGVNYGFNMGSNPYTGAYPPLTVNRDGVIPLTAKGNYPDLGLANSRLVWGEQYKHLINDVGLDMVWQDMTCPAIDPNLSWGLVQDKSFPGDLLMTQESKDSTGTVTASKVAAAKVHNAYSLNLLKATADGINTIRPNQRNFIIARGGYAGIQRYAGLWTGDSASSWDFLRINLPQVLNLGLSGVPISGCDIGGFGKGSVDGLDTTFPDTQVEGDLFNSAVVTCAITNYELLTRWMQLGSFLPWYRNHYDGYNKGFQEPYAYGEPVGTNCGKYIELRYRMLQVYYDAMYLWTQQGLPIARPLFLNDPFDATVYSHANDQFFVGADFLVAPILDPHETTNPPSAPTRSVYLPSGSDWYAFMDNTSPLGASVGGGTTINSYFAPLDLVPIYVRAGAILPFCQLEQWVGQLAQNPLTINCYPGPDRASDTEAYLLYQDDGLTMQSATSASYRTTRIYQTTTNAGDGSVSRSIRLRKIEDKFQPAANFHYVAILGSITTPISASQDGTSLAYVNGPDELAAASTNCWYWNSNVQIAFAKVFDNRPDTTITFIY